MASRNYVLNITIEKQTDKSTFKYVIPNVSVKINDSANLNDEIEEVFHDCIEWEEVDDNTI